MLKHNCRSLSPIVSGSRFLSIAIDYGSLATFSEYSFVKNYLYRSLWESKVHRCTHTIVARCRLLSLIVACGRLLSPSVAFPTSIPRLSVPMKECRSCGRAGCFGCFHTIAARYRLPSPFVAATCHVFSLTVFVDCLKDDTSLANIFPPRVLALDIKQAFLISV